jgi:hypothetical protein
VVGHGTVYAEGMNEPQLPSSSSRSLARTALAGVVLIVAGWFLLHFVIHIALMLATVVAVVVAIFAVIWALRTIL